MSVFMDDRLRLHMPKPDFFGYKANIQCVFVYNLYKVHMTTVSKQV